jgi:HKD family nuclease
VGAWKVHIFAAFVSVKGLDGILAPLLRVVESARVRVLIGLCQSVTEPRILRILVECQSQAPKRFRARIFGRLGFYPKAYFVYRKKRVTAIAGSSNLTADGLGTCRGLNMVLSAPGVSISSLTGVFETDWKFNLIPMTDKLIRDYESSRLVPRHGPPQVQSAGFWFGRVAPLLYRRQQRAVEIL